MYEYMQLKKLVWIASILYTFSTCLFLIFHESNRSG